MLVTTLTESEAEIITLASILRRLVERVPLLLRVEWSKSFHNKLITPCGLPRMQILLHEPAKVNLQYICVYFGHIHLRMIHCDLYTGANDQVR